MPSPLSAFRPVGPAPSPRHGFTLLEVLIVLVLMGVASALVVPVLRGASDRHFAPANDIAVRAQREAIRRAEALQLRMDDTGGWSLRVARTREVLDSGHVRADSTSRRGAWLFDALGGCVPLASETASEPFDALACRAATSGATAP